MSGVERRFFTSFSVTSKMILADHKNQHKTLKKRKANEHTASEEEKKIQIQTGPSRMREAKINDTKIDWASVRRCEPKDACITDVCIAHWTLKYNKCLFFSLLSLLLSIMRSDTNSQEYEFERRKHIWTSAWHWLRALINRSVQSHGRASLDGFDQSINQAKYSDCTRWMSNIMLKNVGSKPWKCKQFVCSEKTTTHRKWWKKIQHTAHVTEKRCKTCSMWMRIIIYYYYYPIWKIKRPRTPCAQIKCLSESTATVESAPQLVHMPFDISVFGNDGKMNFFWWSKIKINMTQLM